MAAKKNLVIVESPAKAKTIGKYLGDDYEVTASMGHIRDLPASQLGIDVEHGYTPQYISIKGKEKLIKELKSKAKHADGVILSTTVTITEGESVMSVLKRACGDAGIPVSSSGNYVRGINGLFEKNVGRSSGWMYCVGGTFPSYGADSYTLSGGENIQWLYTCNMGADVGNTYMG